jgi:hypothetical protein
MSKEVEVEAATKIVIELENKLETLAPFFDGGRVARIGLWGLQLEFLGPV